MSSPEYNRPLLETMRTRAFINSVSDFRIHPTAENLAGIVQHGFSFARDVMELPDLPAVFFVTGLAIALPDFMPKNTLLPMAAMRFVRDNLIPEQGSIITSYNDKLLNIAQFTKAQVAGKELLLIMKKDPEGLLHFAQGFGKEINDFEQETIIDRMKTDLDKREYRDFCDGLGVNVHSIIDHIVDSLQTKRYLMEQEMKKSRKEKDTE